MATHEAADPQHGRLGGERAPGRVQGSSRADEILDVAMQLFAEHGYANTSVADIQTAAGMTPGSGALYKHFPSKQALLEAGVERFVAEGGAAATELVHREGDFETCLRDMAMGALQVLAADSATMRIVWRDLPAFPHLRRRFLDARLQHGFGEFSQWLSDRDQSDTSELEDPEATAAVLLGALAFFRLMETMLGETPGQVSDRRFVDAWVQLASRALTASTPSSPQEEP